MQALISYLQLKQTKKTWICFTQMKFKKKIDDTNYAIETMTQKLCKKI